MTDPFQAAARAERRRAQQRRNMQTGLRIHVAVFVFIQLMLVTVWALSGGGYPWFLFPLLGWGAGLAAHAYAVKGHRSSADEDATADLP